MRAAEAEQAVAERYEALRSVMDERVRRYWAGAEALALGRGGVSVVARATGLSRMTVRAGQEQARGKKPPEELVRVRRRGAGRPRAEAAQPGLMEALESLVDPATRGDPESPLRWTHKSTVQLAGELERLGYKARRQKVGELLRGLGYSLQAVHKTLEGESHSDRNAQFEHINAEVKAFQKRGQPVISVDTKKKEWVGEFKNGGREWQPKGAPVLALTHDFPDTAEGKVIPYGVYDVGTNSAWVSVGVDHDTPVFAVNSMAAWWSKLGKACYPEAKELLVMADSGGSNSAKSRVWKAQLQKLADATGLSISVCHFPPGTSKWNKVEHRLFSHLSINWRGRPLEDYETVVQLIGATTTRKGLKVKARLDKRRYSTGLRVSRAEMKKLHLVRSDVHGEWNYRIEPNSAN
ncbi:ISAzo13-like element ISStau6 family transposase [Stigmatella aurantiaca]|uniref:Transposase n=1 Tax=Stigmatella aurantiaca (strain DW4/3-1) TaxID=378806 RepID=Q099A3_STIAD|nr:ISAzo13-like element ISStau6 family transposase [Stigmatella aurantiaca]ADO75440.1 transposase [Stigmatella aurantiaca DW4/3-1]EAU68322.1 rhodopirellula transposase subfamily [Stigmatella aurantiaca DW4/3-1]